jgi:tetratricopeptide (TPR) repeat protein
MLDGVSTGVFSSDPDTRARAFIERAIASVESGEHESAMADLQEAERIAQAENITELIAAARINQGFAFGVQGDRDAAIRLYRDAAEIARENEDADRLKIALANLSVELKACKRAQGGGRHTRRVRSAPRRGRSRSPGTRLHRTWTLSPRDGRRAVCRRGPRRGGPHCDRGAVCRPHLPGNHEPGLHVRPHRGPHDRSHGLRTSCQAGS